MPVPARPAVRRRGLVVAALTLGLVALTAPPAPAGDGPQLALDPASGRAGSIVDASGSGFPAGFDAVLRLDDPQRGPVLADRVPITAKGTFAVALVIPRGVPAGDHLVHACLRDPGSPDPVCDRMPSARLRVLESPPTTSPTQPPVVPPPDDVPPTIPPTGATTTEATAALGTTVPDEIAVQPTPTTVPIGADQLAGPATTHGAGMGQYSGGNELPDLAVTGMEVTQGIQNQANDMPLVADRTSVLRVYVETDGEPLPNVSGLLQLVRDGDHEVAVLEPDNGPITVAGGPASRLHVDASLNFTLPPEALGATSQGDRLIATAFAFSTHPSTPATAEPTDANNYEAEVFELHAVGDLQVHLLNMHMHESPLPTAPDATLGTQPEDPFAIAATLTSLYRYHPVAGVTAVPGPMIYPPLHGLALDWLPATATEWDLTQDNVQTSILAAVEQVWADTSSTDHLDQYYGIYREDLPRTWGGFSNGTVAYGYVDLRFGTDDPWYHWGGWLMAHELGHSIGFDHVDCDGTEGDPGAYPWTEPACLLAPVSADGYYGWDIRHDAFAVTDGPVAINHGPGLHPERGFPYMGYQSSKWADPWHWCRALVRFGVDCTAVAIPENEVGPTPGFDLADATPYQEIEGQAGWLRLGATIAGPDSQLLDAAVVPDPLPHVLAELARRRAIGEPSGVSARLVGDDGAVLSQLDLVTTMHGAVPKGPDGEERDVAPDATGPVSLGTTDYLPWMPGAAALQLVTDGEVADQRPVSAHAPAIDVLTPSGGELTTPLEITWEASDADGDDLAFDIAYSPDAGQTWAAVAQLVAGPSHTLEDLAGLTGGAEAIFRVTARDGIHATSATSDPAVLPDLPPTVVVLGPGEGTTVPQHRAVTLLASPWDAEDGGGEPTVTWASDVDGPLGAGDQLVVRTLSAGDHELTATATDGAGGSARASVHITVDAARALPRLDADGFAAGLAALRGGPSDLSQLAGHATRGGPPMAWGAAGLMVFAALGAGVAVRRGQAARAEGAR